jgi:hypothetical protein
MDNFTWAISIVLLALVFAIGVIVGVDLVISDCSYYGEFKTHSFEMTCKVKVNDI